MNIRNTNQKALLLLGNKISSSASCQHSIEFPIIPEKKTLSFLHHLDGGRRQVKSIYRIEQDKTTENPSIYLLIKNSNQVFKSFFQCEKFYSLAFERIKINGNSVL